MIVFSESSTGYMTANERFTQNIVDHNSNLLHRFITIKKLEGISEHTVSTYTKNVTLLSQATGQAYETMTADDIRTYMNKYQEERHISNGTLDHMRLTFNSFFKFLVEEDYMLRNPMVKVHPIHKDKVLKLPFSDEDLTKLQDFPLNKRDRAIVDLLYSSGCRVSELVKLNRQDINLKEKEGIVYGKGKKYRMIYFDAKTKLHLEYYLESRNDNEPPLFITHNFPFSRLDRSTVEKLCHDIGEAAGVDNVYPHRFRRTLATNLLRKGMPIEQVQKILGHSNIQTTLIYAAVSQTDVKINHQKYV